MSWSQERYLAALHYAAHAHQGQKVPGTDLPYLVHVASVAQEIMAAIGHGALIEDPDLAIECALLHDVVEDTARTVDEVSQTFGHAVADGVQALTKDKTMPTKREQMADSLARIRLQPKAVWAVKMADRITNLQPPPGYWDSAKIESYRREALILLEALKEGEPYLAERLREKIERYPALEH